jgi:hypothetical protein
MSKLCLALVCLVVSWAPLLGSEQLLTRLTREPAPMEVSVTNVDTVGLGTMTTISISVRCWPKQVRNVTARIFPDSGFEIVRQPQETYNEPDTEAVVFKGMIRATARGIWEVGVEAGGAWPDTSRIRSQTSFYIQISDSLCRAMTATEHSLLESPIGEAPRIPKPDKVIFGRSSGHVAKPGRHGSVGDTCSTIPKAAKVIDTTYRKTAKPAPKDSSTKKDSATKKVSGTFDVIGTLYYHDPRDPQGWLRPARNVAVEVWNDGLLDTPQSADVLLGTGITDWYGCYSFWWLDNS